MKITENLENPHQLVSLGEKRPSTDNKEVEPLAGEASNSTPAKQLLFIVPTIYLKAGASAADLQNRDNRNMDFHGFLWISLISCDSSTNEYDKIRKYMRKYVTYPVVYTRLRVEAHIHTLSR